MPQLIVDHDLAEFLRRHRREHSHPDAVPETVLLDTAPEILDSLADRRPGAG